MIAAAPLDKLRGKEIELRWQYNDWNKQKNYQCKSPVEEEDKYFTFMLGTVLTSVDDVVTK